MNDHSLETSGKYESRIPLSDLQPGQRFDNYLLAVRSTNVRTTVAGKTYLEIKLGDFSDTRSAKIWDPSEADLTKICSAEFLAVTGTVETNDKYVGELRLSRHKVAPRPDNVSEFIQPPPASNKSYQQKFSALVKSIKDSELKAIVKQVFLSDPEVWRRFIRAYAAGAMHHAFPGGLLEHTCEVAELASKACEVLKGLDRDLLVTGALLHDVGKLEEMDHELRAGEYTDDGCLVGHIVIGSIQVANAVDALNRSESPETQRISVKTRRALIHLILSHHGVPEHGAARKPAIPEATILWLCDNMSAKTFMYADAASKNTSNAISAFHKGLDVGVYLRPTRDFAVNNVEDGSEIDLEMIESPTLSRGDDDSRLLPIIDRLNNGSSEISSTSEREYRRVVVPKLGADYLIPVVGDSMNCAGFRDGDLLMVKREFDLKDGDIVVARVADEDQQLKRYRAEGNPSIGMTGAYLDTENPEFPPIRLTEDILVQGKVTGLIRDRF